MSSQIPLALYKKIHASVPIACVDAVVLNNEGEILLCHRTNKPALGTWCFPGGRVLKGETMKDAIIRKVKQETGLKIVIKKQLGTEETMFPDGPFGGPTHTINTVFLAIAKKGEVIKADQQSDEIKWFTTIPKKSPAYIKKFIKLAVFK